MSQPATPSPTLQDAGNPHADAAAPADPAASAPPTGSGLARSAGIVGIGNIASRVIGLARDTIT
ncbi:MAG: hypothetical protein MUC51_09255, partial [Anaerolineae bacterium]|nr:hypothetical protein [Anaerolineae bacterium]